MKYLLVADTHLGIKQASEKYHNVVYNLFEEIINVCKERNISEVIHLGDFFHERKATNTKTLSVALKIAELFRLNSITLYIIVGNHDIYFKNSLDPTILETFKNNNNIKVISEVTKLSDDIVLCPWSLLPTEGKFLFGHFEITGFKMNSSYICENGIAPDGFNGYEHVYSGHFHMPSSKGNITYLGSAFPQTFHDIGSIHGYYIFDNGELEFI